jgi:ATP-dependent helicase/nuclease subunit A
MSKIPWTQDQQAIIDAKGAVYVSASAGTGKTAVLTERVVRLIESGISIENMLIITFTVAAAAEMKERIYARLKKAAKEAANVSKCNYASQLKLVEQTQISTIHSFCKAVIEEFSHEVGYQAGLRVADEGGELAALKEETLREVVNDIIKKGGEDADKLKTLLEGRDHKITPAGAKGSFSPTVLDMILKIDSQVSALPNQDEVLGDCLLKSEKDNCAADVDAFVMVLKRYRGRLAEKKRDASVIEFNDLEQFMLKILQNEDIARQLRERYTHVFVDEYQDVNDTQDSIITSLNRENLFLVGDVKQSIYAFRNSNPSLFFKHIDNAAEENAQVLKLKDNFRSRSEVIDSVNTVFRKVMEEGMSPVITYDGAHELEFGAEYPECNLAGERIEIVCLEYEKGLAEGRRMQAQYVARKINELVAEGNMVREDKDKSRPISYADIAVLMYKGKSHAPIYADEFRRLAIPFTWQSGGFTDTAECADVCSVLRLLDNPEDAVSMAAVLRSPFYGFTDSELTAIALTAKDKKLNSSALDACIDESLRKKIEAFRSEIQALRKDSCRLSISALIWRIINHNGHLAFASSQKLGKFRRANLFSLHKLAGSYEESTSAGIATIQGFLKHLEVLADNDPDSVAVSGGDEVTIQTIHKSKGLEYPVVFLAGADTNFTKGQSQPVVFLPEIGLAVKPALEKVAEGTLPESITDKQTKNAVDEHRRLLYVAMTRAREKLVIVGARKKEPPVEVEEETAKKKKPEENKTGKKKDYKCYWDFLMETDLAEKVVYPKLDADSGVSSRAGGKSQEANDIIAKLKANSVKLAALGEPECVRTKMSASSIGHDKKFAGGAKAARAMLEPEVDPLERGTATHLVFEKLIKAGKAPALKDVEEMIAALVKDGAVGGKVAQSIKVDKVLAFFSLPAGRAALTHTAHSEWSFTALIERSKIGLEGAGEVIVQGVIDLVIEYDGGIEIVDFKTDKTMDGRVEIYSGQLKAYADAAGRIFGKRVKLASLFFTEFGEIVPVALEA